jgi:phage terminase large subunit GpA-like protein
MTTAPASFRDPVELVSALAAAIRPPRRVTVGEAAERHRRLPGNGLKAAEDWSHAKVPYLVEPQERMTSRAVDVVVLVGPSQFAKTELLLNVCAHAVKYRPVDTLIVQPAQDSAKDFVARRLSRMLEASPEIGAELGRGRSDNTAYAKVFKSGMRIDTVWPTAHHLASKPVPLVLLDERDRMTDDVEGEGDPVDLVRKRTTSFGKEGKTLVISSPSKPGARTGIVPLWRRGDQNLWAWPCQQCGDYWTPGFDDQRKPTDRDLAIPEGATAEEAREKARVVCPICGFPHDQSHKAAMMARGVWLPAGVAIDAAGNLRGAAAPNRIASYWLHGLCNPFKPWGDLAAEKVTAEREYEETGEEGPLKTFVNTVLGLPYEPRGTVRAKPEAVAKRAQAEGYAMGTVPDGVRFLTAQVDIQGHYFAVMVSGHSETGERWCVDRFDLRQLADGRTDISPGTHPEHWGVLLDKVIAATYPLASDPSRVLPVATTTIDTGGVDGVTENAKVFWRACMAAGVPELAITLIKGANTTDAPMIAKQPTYLEALPSGKPDTAGPRLWMVGGHAIKDTLNNRLSRDQAGAPAMHYPNDFPQRFFDELFSEVKEKGVWVKRRRRNETWDLEVYATVAFLRLRPGAVDWARPPAVTVARPAAERAPAPMAAAVAVLETGAIPPAHVAAGGRRQRGVRGGVRL